MGFRALQPSGIAKSQSEALSWPLEDNIPCYIYGDFLLSTTPLDQAYILSARCYGVGAWLIFILARFGN